MGGGLLQLVAYGAQDVYLTGNPQITFFKVAYRRHTNFALEAIEQTFNGTPDFNSRVTCQISRNGDLINRVYLQLRLTGTNNYCKYFGLRLLNYVELEIGGQRIDRHYAHWLYIWNELTLPISKRDGWNNMVGAYGGSVGTDINSTLYVPLEFWFCRNIGLALPLIALQYHEVKININFESETKCKISDGGAKPSFTASLWVDYIFLDTDERRRFAQLTHEYLIEQLQFTGGEAISANTPTRVKLNFNHPTKALYWGVRLGKYTSGRPYLSYDLSNLDTMKLLATRRFVLRCCTYVPVVVETVTTGYTLGTTTDNKLTLNPAIPASSHVGKMFEAIDARFMVSTGLDVDNISIFGRLLTTKELSVPCDDLFTSTSSPGGTVYNLDVPTTS